MTFNRIVLTILCAVCLATIQPGPSYATPTAEDLFRDGYRATMERRWTDAIRLYSESIALNPNDPEIYYQRAVAFQMAKKYSEAIRDYEKALALKPDWYLPMEYVARLYSSQGYYKEALKWYQRSLPLVSNSKWRGVVRHWIAETRKKLNSSERKGRTRR